MAAWICKNRKGGGVIKSGSQKSLNSHFVVLLLVTPLLELVFESMGQTQI